MQGDAAPAAGEEETSEGAWLFAVVCQGTRHLFSAETHALRVAWVTRLAHWIEHAAQEGSADGSSAPSSEEAAPKNLQERARELGGTLGRAFMRKKTAGTAADDHQGGSAATARPKITLFGASLAAVQISAVLPDGPVVPSLVARCVKFLDEHGLEQEGLYRISGSSAVIQDWRARFNEDPFTNFDADTDPHAVAGLLKLYMRELPESPLTHRLRPDFFAASNMAVGPERTAEVARLVLRLPGLNYNFLKLFFDHLNRYPP